ncbi:MAG: uroporphyrinogen decarboxylase family protein [Chloroflexota bacterium]
MITHRQRLEACLSNQVLDHPPVALWRHFPVDDQTPMGLANAVLAFQRSYDFDLVKVTPASSYCLKDWGAGDEWRGSSEGTRDYTQRVIRHPEDWAALPLLDPQHGHLAAELEALRLIRSAIGPDTPILQTIFNPLSQAKNLVGGSELLVHMRQNPDALHQGLAIIAESTRRFIEASRQVGIDGIFFAVQHAQYGLLSQDEFARFGRAYDLPLLEPAREMAYRLLHLHGLDVMFDQVADYPVNMINWHDRETAPSLSGGLQRFSGVVCGGVNRHTLVYGTPDQVRAEALEALQATNGQRFMLGTGCVTPVITPHGNLLAVRQAL